MIKLVDILQEIEIKTPLEHIIDKAKELVLKSCNNLDLDWTLGDNGDTFHNIKEKDIDLYNYLKRYNKLQFSLNEHWDVLFYVGRKDEIVFELFGK